MFSDKDIQMIKQSLENGNDVLIRNKKDEIQIIEQKQKILSRKQKNKRCIGTAVHNS